MIRRIEPRQHIIDAELANGSIDAWRQVLGFLPRCSECEIDYSDSPSKLCLTCQAYKEHQS